MRIPPIFCSKGERFFFRSPGRWQPIKSSCFMVLHTATKITGFIIAFIYDLIALPFAGAVLLLSLFKKNWNPKPSEVKKDKMPIMLLHGSNACQGYWIFARQFLKGEKFGSPFSCDYTEGLLFNNFDSGIEDYAKKVSLEMRKVRDLTGQNRFIVVTHSMGTAVGEYYAQHYAEKDGIKVEHIIGIAAPWRSPTIDLLGLKAKRFQQMSKKSGQKENRNFFDDLILNAWKAEVSKERFHWSIWSKHDAAVPGKVGCFTQNPFRQYEASYTGHLSILFSPSVMLCLRKWILQIYSQKS